MLEMNVDSLEWPMLMLAQLDADFVVEAPPELADAVGARRCAVRAVRDCSLKSRSRARAVWAH